jgi:hypothetical protein
VSGRFLDVIPLAPILVASRHEQTHRRFGNHFLIRNTQCFRDLTVEVKGCFRGLTMFSTLFSSFIACQIVSPILMGLAPASVLRS